MFNLITIGDALIDTDLFIDDATLHCDVNKANCQLCLNFAEKIPLTNSFQTLGGNAANVAVAASRLGLKTAILTSVGKDTNGEMVKEELKKQKVDTSLLLMDKKIQTRYSVVLNFKKERTILSYHHNRSYNFPKKMPQTNWIYYTSLCEGYEDLQSNLITFLNKDKNVRLAYNPGSIQLNNLDSVKQVLLHTDILIVNLEEAEKILPARNATQSAAGGNTNLNGDKNINILIKGLLNLGAKEVVITNSSQGAWAGNEAGVWHSTSFPVEIISTNGAGDSFSSGYLAARFYGHNLTTALSWGMASSCRVISSPGPEKNLLNKKEMAKTISQFSSIKPIAV